MNALLPDILEIEQLDFTPDIPCEHSQHELGLFGHSGPAYYLIHCVPPCGCPPLNDKSYFYICKSGYEHPAPVGCSDCGAIYPAREVWHIIGKVGS
jgi:hypothetical protein